jgi:CRISPR-associated protein Csm1
MSSDLLKAAYDGLVSGVKDSAQLARADFPKQWQLTDVEEARIAKARQLANGGKSPPDPTITQLVSPFYDLAGYKGRSSIPLKSLRPSLEENTFPTQQPIGNPGEDLKTLWKWTEREFIALDSSNLSDETKIEGLESILRTYAWCQPSGVEGVSIYDLARTTAAIATCLAGGEYKDGLAVLVSGDVSGLQKFLYTLASAGAAKSLRARSVYLQWLTQALAFSLMKDLGLPGTSLLYVGGGTFQILTHPKDINRLPDLAAELNKRLMALHNGSLGITLAWEALKEADFLDIPEARKRLGKQLNHAKRRPFSALGEDELAKLIGFPVTIGGDPLAFCQVTGEDGETIETRGEETKSKFVWDLEDLGTKLPYATHLVFQLGDKAPPQRAIGWQQALAVLGMHAQVVVDWQPESTLPDGSGNWRIWRLRSGVEQRETEILNRLQGEKLVTAEFFAQLTARHPTERRQKTLEELAQSPDQESKLERWGVLRIDADGMGNLFSSGYGEKASLVRTMGLSFAMRLFFEGWLPNLAASQKNIPNAGDDLRDDLILLYSGGDDLFIVGAWDALPEFARRIRCSLGRFTGGNPQVTISAGIELFSPKFPIYQAARIAEEAENASKKYVHPDGHPKDAITFLGETSGWDRFEDVQRQANIMANLIKTGSLTRAALQAIMQLRAIKLQKRRLHYIEWIRNPATQKSRYQAPKTNFGAWTWLAAYQLSRMIKLLPKKHPHYEETKQLLSDIREDFLNPDAQNRISQNALAARWAQFLVRGGSQ